MNELNTQFDYNQEDHMCPVAYVLWTGNTISLHAWENDTIKGLLATITADENTVRKVMNWCVKNGYRCPQIRGGVINL
ncbi:MAG: hypothetical protein HOO67_05500 [Candidatus Peribacteraceae bacterium]|nr:hypothetical protein [Candidatus Peribacteraceae bacterium]